MADDFDIVSDLNGGDDGLVSAHGSDTQHVNAETIKAPEKTTPQAASDTPAAKPLSLRDQISSALKGGEGDTPPAAQQDGGPVRDAQGRFTSAAASQTGAATPDQGTIPAAAPAMAAPQGIDPQVFASLPAETQASLARTMEGVSSAQQRFAVLEPIEQLIAPRTQAWAMNGMAPAQAIHQLLALSDFASRDAAGFIQYFARTNGVDLGQVVAGMAPQPPVDPAMKALQDELSSVRGQLNGFTQQQQQAAHNGVVNQVVAFAQEKDAQGNLVRPYFDQLGNAVLPYIEMVKGQNPNWSHSQVLQEAYDRAAWATPSIREKLQQAASTAADAERLRQQTDKAHAARTASASVRSGAPSSPPAAPNDPQRTLRDTIRASMAAAS